MPRPPLRQRITGFVRLALYRSDGDHPLRRAYGMVRSIPGVRQIWRLVDTGAVSFPKSIEDYVERGGVFGPGLGPRRELPPIVDFDDPTFFANLFARIEACEPPPEGHDDTIVLVNNGLSAGGAERQIVNTLMGLKKRSIPAAFIGEYLTAPGLDFHLSTVTAAGVDAQALRLYTQPGAQMFEGVSRPVAEQLMRIPEVMLFEILDMVRMFKAMRPAVVHLWQDETSIRHTISALIAGVLHIVVSGRNLNPTHFSYYRPYQGAAYLAMRNKPRVVFSNNSHAGARNYADWLGIDASTIHVVHNGLDFSSWPAFDECERQNVRETLGISPGAPFVLGIFRLSEEKQPLLWIETAAEALKLRPDLHFAIAGEGHMRDAVEAQIAKLGLGARIKLLGEQKNVSSLYMASDAFMLVSAQEGLPNVLLEAQWYGRPVLTTRAGGAPEAVDPDVTGRISDAESASGLASVLLGILGDETLYKNAITAGPAFVKRAFGVDRMVDETLRLYQ